MDEIIKYIAVYALPVLFAITLHEAAHGYAAKHFGDNTAYMMGRVSLDPFKHIDLFGTIILPIVMFAATYNTSFPMAFGYAKPVPVDFGKLRHPKRDMVWVAFAGPASNFLMAFLWLLLAIALQYFQVEGSFFKQMASAGVSLNLVFFVLNLFPLPPLDGGRILFGLLPHKYAFQLAKIEPYGIFIVMILIYTRIIDGIWINPLMIASSTVLELLISPLKLLLN
ncbi:MAG TPA: site-2 protease family protein [Burkholderiaceae bacterium]|nr:site-2 protease family protein [Burkholderiaceae bacterium]